MNVDEIIIKVQCHQLTGAEIDLESCDFIIELLKKANTLAAYEETGLDP